MLVLFGKFDRKIVCKMFKHKLELNVRQTFQTKQDEFDSILSNSQWKTRLDQNKFVGLL